MVDACLIQRKTGESTNTSTGVVTPTYATVYTGRCKVQQSLAQARAEDAGEAYVYMVEAELHLPIDGSEGVLSGDRVTVTASVHDPALVDRVMLIRDEFHKSFATARRFRIQERTS